VNILEIGKPYIKEFFKGSKEERVDQVIDTVTKKIRELVDLPSQAHDLLTKANRGELSVRIAKSDMEGLGKQLSSLSDVMLIVILTVNASTAGLFLVLLGHHAASRVVAGAAVFLSFFAVFKLLKR